MQKKITSGSLRDGFALIIVLGALAILTTLFSISTRTVIAHGIQGNADRVFAARSRESRDLVELALNVATSSVLSDPTIEIADLEIDIQNVGQQISFKDVGGLIDLNTADPALIERIASHLELDETGLDAYWKWRKTPHKFYRVSDFLRVTGASPQQATWLRSISTVSSGRSGVSPQHAPHEVLELIAGKTNTSSDSDPSIPAEFQSEPSKSNYDLVLTTSVTSKEVIGTVHMNAVGGIGRILWMK